MFWITPGKTILTQRQSVLAALVSFTAFLPASKKTVLDFKAKVCRDLQWCPTKLTNVRHSWPLKAAPRSVTGHNADELLRFWLRLAFDQEDSGRAAFTYFTEVHHHYSMKCSGAVWTGFWMDKRGIGVYMNISQNGLQIQHHSQTLTEPFLSNDSTVTAREFKSLLCRNVWVLVHHFTPAVGSIVVSSLGLLMS